MSSEKLAFLQNFYTDVTLYLTPEPEAAPTAAAEEPPVTVTVVRPATPLPAARSVAPPAAVEPAAVPALAVAAVEPEMPSEPTAPTASEVVLPLPSSPAPTMTVPFSTLGSHAGGLVLLMRLPDEQFQKLPRNVFLNKMLQAIGLVMADVVLVNVESDYAVTLASLRTELAATHIIGFGRNLLDVALRTTQIYEPVQFPTLGLAYLASATVESVEYDVSLKKRLWPGLQRMFLR